MDVFRAVLGQRQKMLNLALRQIGIALVGALWLSQNESGLTVSVVFIDLELPVAYVNLFVAMALFGAGLNLINYFVLNEFARVTSNKLLKFDAPWVVSLPEDGSGAWQLPIMNQFRYLQSSGGHTALGVVAVALMSIPLLLVIGLIYWIVFSEGAAVMMEEGLFTVGSVLSFIAFMMTLCPLAYVAIMQIPFTFSKNVRYVRWNFLVPMYRRFGRWPPMVDAWIENEKAERNK